MNRESLFKDTRAATESLGFLLIISMVLLSAGAVILAGGAAVTQTQEAANQESADQAMTQFDSQMSLVAFQGGSEQEVDLSTNSEGKVRVAEQGHITLELKEIDEDDPSNTTTVATLMDRDLGTLEYTTEDGYKTVYQGGGVWGIEDGDPNKTKMVSPPEFTYTDGTATLPFVGINTTSGVSGTDGTVTLKNAKTEGVFPKENNGEAYRNPVDPDNDLVLTVQSKFYMAWGNYFEDRMDISPKYDHANNEVELVMVSSDANTPVQQGILAVGASDRIEINGQGGGTFLDSYDSNNGTYSTTQSNNGEILAQSGLDVSSGATVRGKVVTEGDLLLSGNAKVTGDAVVNGNVIANGGGSEVQGTVTSGANVQGTRPVNLVIESVYKTLKDSNDNNDTTRIDNGEITNARVLDMTNDPTVRAGEYHFSEFNVGNGEKVTFDLQNGDIRIVVDDDINMNRGDIEVINTAGNDNRVQIFTRGDTVEFDRSTVTVEGDRSTALWFYSGAGTYTHLKKSDVTGVIYAPGTDAVPGELVIETQSSLKGGAIGGSTEISSKSSVHYDQALYSVDAFSKQAHVDYVSARISYFHISFTEVEIGD